MKDFYFVFFPIGYDFIKTMECTFKFIPKDCNVVVVTPHPELVDRKDYLFNLTVLKLDDIRDNWSRQNEIINYEKDKIKYRETLSKFRERGIKFPYAVHRFIIPWLAERNVTKFAILDTDCLINFDNELHSVMDYTHNYCGNDQFLFGPIMTEEFRKPYYTSLTEEVLKRYGIGMTVLDGESYNKCFDGYLRGFWFNNTNDLMLFFNLWNELLHKSYKINSPYLEQNGHTVSDEWLFGVVTYILNRARNVRVEDITWGGSIRLIRHIYHPENYYNKFSHEIYRSAGLIENSDRRRFIEENKTNLVKFFRDRNGIPEHRISQVIYDYNE